MRRLVGLMRGYADRPVAPAPASIFDLVHAQVSSVEGDARLNDEA